MNRPAQPEQIREQIAKIITKTPDFDVDAGVFGATVGIFTKACRAKELRYDVMRYLLPDKWLADEQPSWNNLTDREQYAFYRWVGTRKDEETEKWLGDVALEVECNNIIELVTKGTNVMVRTSLELGAELAQMDNDAETIKKELGF